MANAHLIWAPEYFAAHGQGAHCQQQQAQHLPCQRW